jgi:alpha-galactosidase
VAVAVLTALSTVVALASAIVTAAPAVAAVNDLAQVPYMGWNTYYGLGSNFDESTVEAEARAIVDRGLAKAGYNYVWIDGGWWQGQRDASGQMTADPQQWPDGMKAVADYIHSLGLKAGIYTDAGKDGCGGANQGSYGHYQQDANTIAGWGYDAIKVDFCGGHNMGLDPATAYGQFRDALQNNSSHRPILFNICNPFVPATGAPPGQSAYDSYKFGPTTGNSWRTDTDIGFAHSVQYSDMLRNLDDDAKHPEAAGPGHWNDPDYLAPELGFSPAEAQTQFSMWSIVAAPLIIGSDVQALSQSTINMLTNPEVLAIDQDTLGKQGTAIATNGMSQVWVKPLANGDRAVALFNRGDVATTIATTARAVGMQSSDSYQLRNVWTHATTESGGRISAAVAPHSVVLLRVSGRSGIGNSAPSVTLSPVSTPAPYDGSALRLAVPGRSLPVSATLANDATLPIKNVSVTLDAPAGWTVSPQAPIARTVVEGGQSIPLQWQVTPAPGSLPDKPALHLSANYAYTVKADRPVQHTATSTSDGTVQTPYTPPSGTGTLAHHRWLDASSGYALARVDRDGAGGGPLRMNGVTYPSGIGVASPSLVEYYLGGNCQTLHGSVGIDDSAGFDSNGGTATFQVLGDGKALFDSGVLKRPTVDNFDVSLAGVQVVSLVVGDAGDGGYNDRTDWGGLQVSCGAAPGNPWPTYANGTIATASSANSGYPASNAVDGDISTIWHSQFSPSHDPLPISFTVDLGTARQVTGLTYQCRLDGDRTGDITGYRVETSTDGTAWTTAVQSGTWPDDRITHSAQFAATTARYVRLTATDAVNGYASAAEIGVAVNG